MKPFEIFLNELGKILELSSLRPDRNGACLIILKEGQISLLFEYDDELVPNTILVTATLLTFSIQYREDIYEFCLKANQTMEETLSVKPDEDALYLHKRIHPDIEKSDLDSVLKSFIENYKILKEQGEKILQNPPRSSLAKSDSSFFPFKA